MSLSSDVPARLLLPGPVTVRDEVSGADTALGTVGAAPGSSQLDWGCVGLFVSISACSSLGFTQPFQTRAKGAQLSKGGLCLSVT